jgi:hypothetical protein
MVNIYDSPGAEKDILKICPPEISKFDDIKPTLTQNKKILENGKKHFYKQLPERIKNEETNLKKSEEELSQMEYILDEDIDNILIKYQENKLKIWKYLSYIIKKYHTKPRTIGKQENKIQEQREHIRKLKHEPGIIFNQENLELLRKISQYENIINTPEYHGAYGEIKVLKELCKLNDNYHVLCDVKVRLKDYIRYKRVRNLRSAQIDFVVVGPTGIFAVEVKNWSNNQIMTHSGISPYEQIDRAGLVLWVYLKKRTFFFKPKITKIIVPIQKNIKYNSGYKSVLVQNVNRLNNFIYENINELSHRKIKKVVSILY